MKKPNGDWLSITKFKRDPLGFSRSLTRNQAVELAKYLDYMYHSRNKSLVPDEVYDILKDSIAERWPKTPYLKQVGHKPSNRTETTLLPVNMPSMDKFKPDNKKLPAFLRSSDSIVASDKLDGISLLLEYDDGKLIRCYTRGDGNEGQDVSGVIPALKCPKKISIRTPFMVRCEFIIKKKSFGKFSKAKGGDYSTGRNMGGGLLTHNKPTAQVKSFDVVAYEISKGRGAGTNIEKQFDILKRLKFNVVRFKKLKAPTKQDIEQVYTEFRSNSNYEIDGIIIDRNVPYRISSTNPKHAKAFKINSLENSKVVPVKEVEFRRSRLNRLIPRIIIDPINLGGVTVTYFTGHSYFYIQHGYTYSEYKKAQKEGKRLRTLPINKGAKIRVIRSGDVIPYIMGVERPARKAAKPTLDYKLGPNNVHAIAIEDSTDADEKKRITHFFSSLKIEGLKIGVVSKLYDAGFDSISKILFAEVEELMDVEGIQSRMATNIVKNIDIGLSKAKFSTIGYASQQFDEAIGSKRLQSVIDTYPDFVEQVETKTIRQLTSMIEVVPGIKTQARMIAEGSKRFIKWLDEVGLNLEPEETQVITSDKLSGLKVLFTGVRDADLLESILENGGEKAGTVKTANVLITKPDYSNKKTQYAEENNIPMYTAEEFKQKYKL